MKLRLQQNDGFLVKRYVYILKEQTGVAVVVPFCKYVHNITIKPRPRESRCHSQPSPICMPLDSLGIKVKYQGRQYYNY